MLRDGQAALPHRAVTGGHRSPRGLNRRSRMAMSAPARNKGGKPGNGTAHTAAPARDRTATTPLWLQLSTLALSLCGLGVSVYLTVAHYTAPAVLACPDTGVINCEKVTTSPES